MKKIVIAVVAALALVAASDASAQSVGRKKPKYPHQHENVFAPGIHFGYVHSGYSVRDIYSGVVDRGVKRMDGVNLGLTMDFTLIPHTLYFHSGLDYVYQMNNPEKENNKDFAGLLGFKNVSGKNKDHNLDIPIQLKYKYDITPSVGVFAQLGPTLSFGMSSKMVYRGRTEDGDNVLLTYNYYTGKLKTKGTPGVLEDVVNGILPESRFKSMDVRLGGAVGATLFEIFEASVGYQQGLVNKFKGEIAKEDKMRRGMFYLTVGVRF